MSGYIVHKATGVSDRYPALEESVENGHLAEEVQDWDWRRWFAALPMKNYDSFTGGTGILDFGLRPIDGTVDPNGSGPIWDFYLVLDKQPPVTVHIHPGAEDKLITCWSTRTDRERASDQTALTAVNPNCSESAFWIMYESCPLDPPKLVAPSYGFEASSSAVAVPVGGRTESTVGGHDGQSQVAFQPSRGKAVIPPLAEVPAATQGILALVASGSSWSLVPCDNPADELCDRAGVVQFSVAWPSRAQQAKAACKQAARGRPEFRLRSESALPTIAEVPTEMVDWSSGSWFWWGQAGRWWWDDDAAVWEWSSSRESGWTGGVASTAAAAAVPTGVAPDGAPTED